MDQRKGRRMQVKTSRKTKEKIPTLDGWTFFPFTTNLYLRCQVCNKLPGEMFYRSVKDDGVSYTRTEGICVACADNIPKS